MNSVTENIWDTFWTIAAAISGLGLPGAILLLLVCYFVVFLRWACRDSSFAEALRATQPGRRLWFKIIVGTGAALFVLNLPLCSLELLRYSLYVAAAVCVISIFSKSLRDATRLSQWPFWLITCGLFCVFDLLLWAYCRSAADAAGLESFLPFMELLLIVVGCGLFFLATKNARESFSTISLRVALCLVALLVVEHTSVQVTYFLTYRLLNARRAEDQVASTSLAPVSEAMRSLMRRSAPRPLRSAVEEKGIRARVDFEEDLARIMAFFFGLAGFNAIVAVTSRRFGVRDAKKIPMLVTLGPAHDMGKVPEMPESVRRSVFFPNRQYRRGHRATLLTFAVLGNFFVSAMTAFSSSKGELAHFLLSFVAYSGMLYPPIMLGCRNGFRLAAYRARSSIHGVRILMHNPSYVPLEVKVRKPTILQRIQHRITGAWIRHAVDKEGRLYSLMFGHCPYGEFPAQLYQLRAGPLNESLTGRQAYVAIPKAEIAAPALHSQGA
ncbi:MAG: hypothetical protein ACXVB9_11910 [Bdellovibrionota bacterium]